LEVVGEGSVSLYGSVPQSYYEDEIGRGKRLLTFVHSSFLALFVGQTLDHDHTAWMSLEQIVDERDERLVWSAHAVREHSR
jgi:hypothetical protein